MCNGTVSVCPIRPLQQRGVGLLLWARRVGDIWVDCCTAGAVANAGSAAFTADEGS